MAACNKCGGLMKYFPEKNMLKCDFCGNEEPLEQMINVENLNVSSGVLDADTMFENWLVGMNNKLLDDYKYRYAKDVGRIAFMRALFGAQNLSVDFKQNVNNSIEDSYAGNPRITELSESFRDEIQNLIPLINKYLVGERFGKYHSKYMGDMKRQLAEIDSALQEYKQWQQSYLQKRKKEKSASIISTIVKHIVFISIQIGYVFGAFKAVQYFWNEFKEEAGLLPFIDIALVGGFFVGVAMLFNYLYWRFH